MKKTICHIANMDRPTEEQLIRKRLEGMPGIERLEFKVLEGELAVIHRGADEQAILQALASLGIFADMGASLLVVLKGVWLLRLHRGRVG